MCLHMQICMCGCECLLVYFGYSCPFSDVLKVRWPPVASCNWSYATVWDCMLVCTYIHTDADCIFAQTNSQPDRSMLCDFSLFNSAALFGYFTLLCYFCLWVKSYFRFHFNAAALSCMYVYECVQVCHIIIVDWHQKTIAFRREFKWKLLWSGFV